MGMGCGVAPFFSCSFYLNYVGPLVSVFELCAELWASFEETSRVMGTILDKCCKIFRELGINQSCILSSKMFSTLLNNGYIFHHTVLRGHLKRHMQSYGPKF